MGAAVLLGALGVLSAAVARDGERQDGAGDGTAGSPGYLTSPYHRRLDGDGNIIPCRCRFQGRAMRVGEVVCMETHLGTVMARCDLVENNTSWIPTATPCEISQNEARRYRFTSAPRPAAAGH